MDFYFHERCANDFGYVGTPSGMQSIIGLLNNYIMIWPAGQAPTMLTGLYGPLLELHRLSRILVLFTEYSIHIHRSYSYLCRDLILSTDGTFLI